MGKIVPITKKIHPAFTYKGAFKPYRSYNFVDKDPVIFEVRKIVEESGLSYAKIAERSGVSESTLYNWFYGKTRRPQSASIEAVLRALGYHRTIIAGNENE